MMTAQWVENVWNVGAREACHANDPLFAKFACPPFQGLVVCVSQIKEREALKKMVESNGGLYSGQLELGQSSSCQVLRGLFKMGTQKEFQYCCVFYRSPGKTNILVTPVAEGDKYVYAKRWKIRCVRPEWIYQSISKGHAVDPDEFVVVAKTQTAGVPRCSTPEADHTAARFGHNGSVNSTILNDSHILNVNDTVIFFVRYRSSFLE